MSLTVTAIDAGDDRLTYAFDWHNNGSFEPVGQAGSSSHTWYNQGNYPVGIRVEDSSGGQTFTSTTASVYNEPPGAIAGADEVRFEGEPVHFDADDSYDPGHFDVLTYTWRFGDGHTANGMQVTHLYADNGIYSATLTVTDDSGAASDDSIAVSILNANPIAEAGPDLVVDEGANVSILFAGTASDPGRADILTYAWDFNYDGVSFRTDFTGATGVWTYPNLDGPAEHWVALRVRDDDYPYPASAGGEIGEVLDSFKITVSNLPPQVDAGGPYTGLPGQPLILTGTATDAPLDLPTLTYEWDLDANPLTSEAAGQTISHTWTTRGTYTVRLRVTDKDGGIGFASAQVIIHNHPIAEAGGPYSEDEGVPLSLTAAGSFDPDGDPLSYTWDFGDGAPDASGITVTHVYTNAGVYTATLSVDDGRGGVATDSTPVVVNDVPPTAVVTASSDLAFEGQPVTFDGNGSSAGRYDTLAYQWDFGDGSPIANGINMAHTYADNGLYTVTLMVTDDDGSVDTNSIVVAIRNANPVAVASAAPNPGLVGAPITFDANGSSDPGLGDTHL